LETKASAFACFVDPALAVRLETGFVACTAGFDRAESPEFEADWPWTAWLKQATKPQQTRHQIRDMMPH
jgi:hypothetical protein